MLPATSRVDGRLLSEGVWRSCYAKKERGETGSMQREGEADGRRRAKRDALVISAPDHLLPQWTSNCFVSQFIIRVIVQHLLTVVVHLDTIILFAHEQVYPSRSQDYRMSICDKLVS